MIFKWNEENIKYANFYSNSDAVEDLFNAVLHNATIYIMQKFLSISNAFYNHRNIGTFFKKKKKSSSSSEFKIS